MDVLTCSKCGGLRRVLAYITDILMEPNDQYLCIVPARSTQEEKVHLPFEGDSLLSVILSKALLLVGDDRIKDPTITRQIAG